tara:strand:- start:2496 stop:5351 length:2856 start_codon:yes stop_codon:yes gene_type:complete
METLIIIAKSAAILSLFYLSYRIVLQRDTFFEANRHYLIGGIVASLTLPFLQFTRTSFIDMPVYEAMPVTTNFSPLVSEMSVVAPSFIIDWWMVALVTYLVGVGIMLVRLTIQLVSLNRLIQKHPKSKHGRYTFIEVYDDIAPFSFFQTIVYNPTVHSATELEMILEHEKVHAMQWHTIDVLLTQITLAIQWANPLAWLYKESLEQNLEFIADSEAARIAASSTAYQRTLVKVSSTALRPALTNNFYQSLIKKRIVMLNKEASSRRNLWKLGIVLPMLGVFMYSFHVKEVVEYREVTPSKDDSGSSFLTNGLESTDLAPSNENIKGEVLKETLTFEITRLTTDTDLANIEIYFEDQFENTKVRFSKVNHINGELRSFDFSTKMGNQDRFQTRFSLAASNNPISYTIIPIAENEIKLLQGTTELRVTDSELTTSIQGLQQSKQLGANPVIVVNGKIIGYQNEITIESENAVSVLKPSQAMATYGGEAKDGALVLEGPNSNIKVNGKYLQKPTAFIINAKTTDSQLRTMERYFAEAHPEAIIEVRDTKRNAAGALISYDVRTKFANQNEWNQVLGVHNAASVSQGMQVSLGRDMNGATIDLQELGPKGILLRSTPSRLLVEDETLGKGLSKINEGFQTLSKDLNTMQEQEQQTFRVKITKNSTIEDLNAIKASLKRDHNVDFNFSNLDFNANNEITGLTINYNTPNDNSGNYNVHGESGIADVYFYMEANGAVGLGQDKSYEETRVRMEKRRAEMGVKREERLEEMKIRREERLKEHKMRSEQRIEEMEVRNEERKKEMKERRKEMRERMKEHGNMVEEHEVKEMKEIHEEREIEEEQEEEIHNRRNSFVHQNPSDVSGSNLFIVSNDAGIIKNSPNGMISLRINKNTSDNELEAIKNEFKSKGVEMKYSKVKRNSQGAITGISIKLQRGDDKSSTSFSSNNPIQTIWLGFSE